MGRDVKYIAPFLLDKLMFLFSISMSKSLIDAEKPWI